MYILYTIYLCVCVYIRTHTYICIYPFPLMLASYIATVHFSNHRNSHWYRFYSHFTSVSTRVPFLSRGPAQGATLHSVAGSPSSLLVWDSFSVSPLFSWPWCFRKVLVRYFVDCPSICVWRCLMTKLELWIWGKNAPAVKVPFLSHNVNPMSPWLPVGDVKLDLAILP